MSRKAPEDLLKKIKERKRADEKGNFTFHLPKRLMEGFKAKCEKEGVSMSEVLEELVKSVTGAG